MALFLQNWSYYPRIIVSQDGILVMNLGKHCVWAGDKDIELGLKYCPCASLQYH